MKSLIAVITCHKFEWRANKQRKTWVNEALAEGFDVLFFVGHGEEHKGDDVVHLDVADDYESLPCKVKAMFSWAADHGYDYIMKTDDDTVIRPVRLKELIASKPGDYFGRCMRGAYCSGFGYILTNKAAHIVAQSESDNDWAEDRWVGKSLAAAGIESVPCLGFALIKFPNTTGPFRCWRHRHTHVENCIQCDALRTSCVVLCAWDGGLDLVEQLYETAIGQERVLRQYEQSRKKE